MSKLMSLPKFARNYNADTVYVDTRFQRRKSWDLTNKREFLESLSKNWVRHQNIVVADVAACLAYSQEINEADGASSDYFENILDAGYKYLSLDGQNRTSCLNDFKSGELQYVGAIRDADGKVHTIQNLVLNEMPQRVQDHLNTVDLISVEVVEEVTYEDLRQFFLSYNAGCPLSPQERRHAEPTPLSQAIEDLAQKYMKDGSVEHLHTAAEVTRMKNNELIVKMLVALIRGVGEHTGSQFTLPCDLQNPQLDNFYKLGNGSPDMTHSPYLREETKRAATIIDMAMKVYKTQTKHDGKKSRIQKDDIWAVLLACEFVYDNNYVIVDRQKFFTELVRIEKNLVDESERVRSEDTLKAAKAGADAPSIEKYYFRWVGTTHKKTGRERRTQALTAKLADSATRYKLTLKKKV